MEIDGNGYEWLEISSNGSAIIMSPGLISRSRRPCPKQLSASNLGTSAADDGAWPDLCSDV